MSGSGYQPCRGQRRLIEVALRAQRDVVGRQEDEAFADPSLTQGTIRLEGLDDEAVGEAVGTELISAQLLEGSTEAVVRPIGRLLEELRATFLIAQRDLVGLLCHPCGSP